MFGMDERRDPTGGLRGLPGPQPVGPIEPGLVVSSSFEDFYEIEQGGLFGALCLITGNRQEAEELKQEAFLKVWERWDLVQSLENPTGYLYRTAMNEFRMRRRRLKMAARKMFRPRGPGDAFEAAEARREIDRGLAALTRRQRAAVVLIELLGYSPSEAAGPMGVKADTVRKLAQQGRERLRAALAGAESPRPGDDR